MTSVIASHEAGTKLLSVPFDTLPAEEGDQVYWRTQKWEEGSEPQFRGPYSVEVPNRQLREASSIADLGVWYSIAEAWAHTAAHFAPADNPRVIDIGCGGGKVARFFLMNPQATYLGIDVHRPAIAWCQKAFAGYPNYEFIHLDAKSSIYNPDGMLDAANLTIPVTSGSGDLIICGSLFTHLLKPAFRHYLHEVYRLLSNNGRAIVSTHNEPVAPDFSGDESRIDVSNEHFFGLSQEANLRILANVGTIFSQEIFVLERMIKS